MSNNSKISSKYSREKNLFELQHLSTVDNEDSDDGNNLIQSNSTTPIVSNKTKQSPPHKNKSTPASLPLNGNGINEDLNNQTHDLSLSHNLGTLSRAPVPSRNYNSYRSSMEFYRLKLSRSKLKAVTRTSALLSGFAMVAMVELGLDYTDYFEAYKEELKTMTTTNSPVTVYQFNNATNKTELVYINNSTANLIPEKEIKNFLIPESVLILYSLVTCLLVGVHMLALMISTCILPQIEASSFEQADFEAQNMSRNDFLNNTNIMPDTSHPNTNRNFSNNNYLTPAKGANNDRRAGQSPHGFHGLDPSFIFPYDKFHRSIELAWISSTVLGIFLFLVEIGLVCYIKFYPISFMAAVTGAIVMVPILILFVLFTVTFYKRLAGYKLNMTQQFLNQVDRNLLPLRESNFI